MKKIKVEVDPELITNEIRKLIDNHKTNFEQKPWQTFSVTYPEIYKKVYFPAYAACKKVA